MATKMVGVRMNSGDPTVEKNLSNKVMIWLAFKLGSARTELLGSSPGGRQPCRGVTVAYKVSYSSN